MRTQLSMISLIVVAALAASGCQGRLAYNLPPSSQLMHPGPGVGGPGPGVIPPGGGTPAGVGFAPVMGQAGSDICQCSYDCGCGPCAGGACGGYPGVCSGSTSQIAFLGEDGIQVQWDVSGRGMFDSVPLVVPGRQDFSQGALYRLKISNIPGRPGVQLYPTLEVAAVTPRTDAYLAHAPVPVQFTEEDFDQALSGNYITKVMYLPDPEFQDFALAGVETLVSARLDPGVNPIDEADHRGSILAILRMGNKQLEMGPDIYSDGGVLPAGYEAGGEELPPDPSLDTAEFIDDPNVEEASAGGGYYDGAAANNMPMGVPTSGFAPAAVPPHMLGSLGPQWGMPMSGTPIGLPGPPHIPLGAPAGLQKHVMKNRTRRAIPTPVEKTRISVKQRPGLNYPEPARKVMVDETARQPFNLRALLGM